MYTCGAGEEGQLGLGKQKTELVPQRVNGIPERVVEAAAGVSHTCAITETGALWATGSNSFGQLGIGSAAHSLIPVQVSALNRVKVKKVACGQYTAAVSSLGELYVWGVGNCRESMHPRKLACTSSRIINVSIGDNLGAALDEGGKLWLWGLSREASDSARRPKPVLVESLLSRTVVGISCGGTSAIALGQTHGCKGCKINSELDFVPTRMRNEDASTRITGTANSSAFVSVNGGQGERSKCSAHGASFMEINRPDLHPRMLCVAHSGRKENSCCNSEAGELAGRREVGKKVAPSSPLNCLRHKSIDELQEQSIVNLRRESFNLGKSSENISEYSFHKGEFDELGDKIFELERENESLKEIAKSEEEKGMQIVKRQTTISKKYANAKAKLLAHIETEEKLLKENASLIHKLREAEEELHVLRAAKEQLASSLELLKPLPRNASSVEKLQECAQKLKESQEEVLGLKSVVRRLEEERTASKRELIRQEEQTQSLLFTLKNELQSVKQCNEIEVLQKKVDELTEENMKLKSLQERLEKWAEDSKRQQTELTQTAEIKLKNTQSLLNELTEENYKLKEVQRKCEEIEEENQKLRDSQKKIDLFLEETHNIKRSQRSIDGLLDENQRLRDQKEKLTVAGTRLQCRVDGLEAELRQLTGKLAKAKKVNEELEERNYRLMDALHQDVNSRAKLYRARALSILCQPVVKEHLALLEPRSCKKPKENALQLSTHKNSKGRSLSPYRIPAADESHEEFTQLHRENSAAADESRKEVCARRVLSPITQEDAAGKVPPLAPGRKSKPPRTGMAAKLVEFEEKLRKSLSRVDRKSIE